MIGFLLRRQAQVPPGDGWLSADERRWLDGPRSAKRVADWRLGRFAAKQAARAFLARQGRPLPDDLEVLAAEDGAPELFAGGRPLPLALSLSHSHGHALSVVAEPPIVPGCDLERIEPRSAAFVDGFFTASEQATLDAAGAAARELLVNLIWSAKESALKALRRGLRVDTRSVEVSVGPIAGRSGGPLRVVCAGEDDTLEGGWRRLDDLVATIVCPAPLGEIIDLDESSPA